MSDTTGINNLKQISAARESIGVGSIVELKSGGPPMTVVLRTPDVAQVIWHNAEGDMYRDIVPLAVLKVRG
jgi:uncharacterized protein YodC (DUF2158 family)